MPSLTMADSEDLQERQIEENYLRCLQEMLREEERGAAGAGAAAPARCPRVWDGIMCWGESDAGETATLPCPDYVAGFVTTANATRRCLDTGHWYFRPEEPNATWTNYSQCVPANLLTQIVVAMPSHVTDGGPLLAEWVPIVRTTALIGYSVSLITLILAFVIMASIRRLRCPRNVLHMHLFVSFMMRAFMSLLKESLFIKGIDLTSEAFVQGEEDLILSEEPHGWQCKLMISVWQFFIVANYSWVFMEGLYLHNLIFQALFTDTNSITMYVALGWGLPLLSVVPWVSLRAIFEDTFCWTTNDQHLLFLVIRIPVGASILINFVLFLRIVRVVFKKLQSSISEETRRYRYRRWAKSTLVLVPLFGIHYTLFLGMSFSIGLNPVVEIAWLFCDLFFASFQGAFVAVLYCFMNGEVKTEISKLWDRSVGEKKAKLRWLFPGAAPDGGRRSKVASGLLAPLPVSDPESTPSGNSNEGPSKAEVQMLPVRTLLGRQMSAPPCTDAAPGARQVIPKWWSRRRRLPAAPNSCSTTHCSVDCDWSAEEGAGKPLLPGPALRRTASAGVPSNLPFVVYTDQVPEAAHCDRPPASELKSARI